MNAKAEIQVLSEAAHLRLRPGMYVGSTSDATHLFNEIIDNSLDEANAGYCTRIDIHYDNESFSVTDNGRGISQAFNNEHKEYDPILIATKLFSGGKFNKDNYKISVGLNGIGLTCCNYLSDKLSITTARDGSLFEVEFVDGIPKKPKISSCGKKDHGTSMEVFPSPNIFESVKINEDVVMSRARLAATFIENLVIFINDKIVEPFKPEDFCPKCDVPMLSANITLSEGEGVQVYFSYDTKATKTDISQGSVNLLSVNRGAHIKLLERVIVDAWQDIFDKETREYLDKYDSLIGLKGFIFINIKEPSWSSQTKDELGGRIASFNKFSEKLVPAIAKQLNTQKFAPFKKALIAKFKDYRSHQNQMTSSKFLDEVLTVGEVAGWNINRGIKQDSKLVDCSSTDRENTEIYIVEGDSAGGNLIAKRDRKIHAILPLRGKVLNVVNKGLEEILNNLEIRSLINAIGCGVKHKEDPSLIRYSKIIIASDGDVDGKSIQALLIGALCYLIPKTVQKGLVYVAEAPLFAQTHKKEFIPVWNEKDLVPGVKTSRFKGLGSFNADELYFAVLNPATRRLHQITSDSPLDAAEIVGNPSARKDMLLRKGVIR